MNINNNRLIFWILIFLVVINITAMATYFIYLRKPASEPGSGFGHGIALKQELSLAQDQSLEVNKINETYKASSDSIITAIKEKKADLLLELSKENTDIEQVKKLADEVVTEQKKLQMANIKQFLDLKKVCTPEQTKTLSQIYSELYGCEDKKMGKGQGKGKGKGMRHRYGQQ